ncbi:ABC transporter permease [Flavitalea sp.]|nr:ABC transporter permease [Flavitalea sp.]
MFYNYFKTAFRNLVQNPVLSFITIFGFSFGLGFVILISIFISNELSYDQFHSNKSCLYRITGIGTDDKGNVFKAGNTKAMIAPLFTGGIAAIKRYCRIDGNTLLIKKNNDVISATVTEADSTFFDMFSFHMLQGNKSNVLRSPDEAIITDETALKIYGSLNVMGKIVELEKGNDFIPFRITGVVKKAPNNSTIFFDLLIPLHHTGSDQSTEALALSWVNTFVQANEKVNTRAVEEVLTKRYNEYMAKGQQAAALIRFTYHLQPISDMHLNEEFYVNTGLRNGSSKTYSYVLGGIAIFILLIACINFINLAMVRAMKRSKEIGIRKVVGSTRAQLILQFLNESLLIGIFSLVPAILIIIMLLPYLSAFVKMEIDMTVVLDNFTIMLVIGLTLLTGLAAGAYPALVLSSFKPIQALAGRIKLSGKNLFNKGLIVFQFTLAVLLIICTLTMHSQFVYLSDRNLGYNTSDIMAVELPRKTQKKVLPLMQNELNHVTGISKTTITDWGMNRTKFTIDGNNTDWCYYQSVDEHFTELFNIRVVQGRNFFAASTADSSNCLVNQAFARAIGADNVIGKQVGYKNRMLTIIGVTADYHLASLQHEVSPVVLMKRDSSQFGQLYIQHESGQFTNIRASITSALKKIDPWHKPEIRQLRDLNAEKYSDEKNWATVINFSSVTCIIICCLGLFALSSFNIIQRMKEIGIRKMLGANAGNIMILMTKEFLKLVVIASIIAAPIGWWVMNEWLQNFAYRIEIQWWLFAAAGFMALMIAALTISFQTIRAAIINPVRNMQ